MNYSRSLFSILLALFTLDSALLSDQKSIFSTTFEAFAIHCKQIKKNSELIAEALKSGDYSEIINLNDQNNCCSLEIPNTLLKGFNSCIAQNDKDIYFPQLISLSNETNTNQKCIKITFNLFCEHISNIKFNTKSTYNLDQSMNSCLNSFVQLFEDNREDNGKKNVILIEKGDPMISYSTENILMRSFESEKLELKCVIQSHPQPDIQWLRNNQIISELNNSNIFEIKTEFQNLCKTTAILEFAINSKYIFANYSCIAINSIGKTLKTFLIDEMILSKLRNKMKVKRFNINGFIIGMCPPMLISFYIIIKLGYRSRYAQERTDENGQNEEPFFVSN